MGMPLRILKFAMDFFAARDDGFLARDLAEFLRRGVQQLDVLAASPEADVDGDLLQRGHAIMFLQPKVLHQRGH